MLGSAGETEIDLKVTVLPVPVPPPPPHAADKIAQAAHTKSILKLFPMIEDLRRYYLLLSAGGIAPIDFKQICF